MTSYLKLTICAICMATTTLIHSAPPVKQRKEEASDITLQNVFAVPVAAGIGVIQGIAWPIRDLMQLALKIAQSLDLTITKNPHFSHLVESPQFIRLFHALGYIGGLAVIYTAPYFLASSYKQRLYCYIIIAVLTAAIATQIQDSHVNQLLKLKHEL